MKNFDFLKTCKSCQNWCCKNENPFASSKELAKLKIDKITTKKDGTCQFLGPSGKCSEYKKRPFECRIFPFDIIEIKGKLYWVLWKNCPAYPSLKPDESVTEFETGPLKNHDFEYIKEYVDFHKKNQPKKYSDKKYVVVKEIKF
jgi:Fe-S-cluster containining protein